MSKFNYIWVICLFSSHIGFAQCCSPGNPIGGRANLGVMEYKSIKFITNYNFSYSGQYYNGSIPVDPYFVKNGYFNHIGINLSYAISNRLTTEFETGYFINKTQTYIEGILPIKKQGYGITNVTFIANINLFRNINKDFELTTGLGFKYPIGSFNRITYQGAILPLDIQPSTGAADFIHTLFIYKEYLEKHWRFFITNRIEIKGINPDGYNYGNLYATSLYVSFNLSYRWNLIMQLRNEIREKDERPAQTPPYEKQKIPVSGSKKIFISPQLSYSFSQNFNISVITDSPVYQYYYEEQLASSFAFSIILSKMFNTNN